MYRRMCRAKIHRAKITHANIDYEGSIEIDEVLMQKAGILENEMVLVANMENGNRFETYTIKGKPNSGVVGLNGAAARLGNPGDLVIIMSVTWMDEDKAKNLKPVFVDVDSNNKFLTVRNGVTPHA